MPSTMSREMAGTVRPNHSTRACSQVESIEFLNVPGLPEYRGLRGGSLRMFVFRKRKPGRDDSSPDRAFFGKNNCLGMSSEIRSEAHRLLSAVALLPRDFQDSSQKTFSYGDRFQKPNLEQEPPLLPPEKIRTGR